MSSPRLLGIPVAGSTTSRTFSGGFLWRSRTSRATRASVRGGRFSEVPLLPLPAREYWRYDADVVVDRAAALGDRGVLDDDMVM
jgi:hypothetical protein